LARVRPQWHTIYALQDAKRVLGRLGASSADRQAQQVQDYPHGHTNSSLYVSEFIKNSYFLKLSNLILLIYSRLWREIDFIF